MNILKISWDETGVRYEYNGKIHIREILGILEIVKSMIFKKLLADYPPKKKRKNK